MGPLPGAGAQIKGKRADGGSSGYPKSCHGSTEDQIGGGQTRRVLSQSHGILAGPDIKITGGAAGNNDIHLRALGALGGFKELQEEGSTLGWQTTGSSFLGRNAVDVAPA
jgi:hypothetical protein